MKKILLIVFLWIPLILLTGCGDVKEIQDLNYATAIGTDYKDNKYVTYVQMISLNTLSNTEGSGSSSPEIMVSETSASTFSDALFEVYEGSLSFNRNSYRFKSQTGKNESSGLITGRETLFSTFLVAHSCSTFNLSHGMLVFINSLTFFVFFVASLRKGVSSSSILLLLFCSMRCHLH
ncbi:hypothetical protein [Halobacillus trueperi]|uniref:Ger(x)C family spore germination protein n=1 Tax=Halobacillus trueperi TaxID=156205 RepID=UPI003736A241